MVGDFQTFVKEGSKSPHHREPTSAENLMWAVTACKCGFVNVPSKFASLSEVQLLSVLAAWSWL